MYEYNPTHKRDVGTSPGIVEITSQYHQNSSVGIATGYRTDGWGVIPNKDKRLFLTHPAFYTMGIQGPFPWG
jgi:hypothetical protein